MKVQHPDLQRMVRPGGAPRPEIVSVVDPQQAPAGTATGVGALGLARVEKRTGSTGSQGRAGPSASLLSSSVMTQRHFPRLGQKAWRSR